MGFSRRFQYFPGFETITQIEGVVIVDLPPPSSIQGVNTGVACIVGEFADMTYAVAVSSTGAVTTSPQPVEIFSGQDLLDKVGGFDSTIGQHGNAGGNGFVTLRNKRFARLIVVPVNLASAGAGRAWRDLPGNLSLTSATPVVPLLGGTAAAGREFKSGVNRVHIGARALFTNIGHYKNGVDGAVTNAGAPAATQTFNAAGGAFLTAYNGGPVPKGAILQLGLTGTGSGGTYRVQTAAVSNTALVVEKLDGSSFDWTTAAAQPYRLHPQTDADTGGIGGVNAALADTSGYKLPCRPLDATIAAATNLAPTVIPTAATATTWDQLSGLTLRSHQSNGFVYTALVQAVNAANDSTIDALYSTAVDSLMGDAAPARDVNLLVSSRASDTIRTKLKSHVLDASSLGVGRTAQISPNLQTVSVAAAIASAAPGVGATRNERVDYSWPGAKTFVPEAVGFSLGTADGLTTTDGVLDVPGDAWLTAVLSNLPPERNPGQAAPPVPLVLAPVAGIQRGVAALGMADYMALKANGIAGLRMDRNTGPQFQSGITSSLTSTELNINRRRFADFLEDSIANSLAEFVKLPLTQALKDDILTTIDGFCGTLLSPSNLSAQRIDGYLIDAISGNTPTTTAQGIYVVIVKVRMTPTADFLVLQAEVGNTVDVSVS